MAMKTLVRDLGDRMMVSFEGRLDFESSDSFRDWLQSLAPAASSQQIVFDLGLLQFVGSSGITQFIDSLKEFNHNCAIKPVYFNVGSEFRRMIRVFDDSGSFRFWDSLGDLIDN